MKRLIILGVLLSSVLFAEEITMTDAVEKALMNNKGIKQAELNLENYKLQKNEALRSGIFSVTYNGGYSVIDPDTKAIHIEHQADPDSTSLDYTQVDVENTFSHSITLTQPLFVGGKVLAGIKTAAIYERSGEYTLSNIKKNVRLDIMRQYLNIIMFEKNLEVLKNSLNELEENYKRLEESYKLKMVTKTEVLELRYSMIELESSIIEIENSIEIFKLRLKNDVGINKSDDIELIDIEDTDVDLLSIDIVEDIEKAYKNNLNIQLANINYKLKKESEVITRAELLPEVMFTFNYGALNQESIGDAIDPDNMSWNAGINFSMDIWDWGNNNSQYKRDKNNTKSIELLRDDKIEEIELSIRSLYLDLLRLNKVMLAKEESLKSAKENYELEKERYAADLISTTDYIAAQNRLVSSETELTNTELNYYLAYEMYKNEIEGEWK